MNESISEEEKRTFDFSCFNRPSYIGPLELYKWTIDRERGAILLRLGGGGGPLGAERDTLFGLWYRGDVIYFNGYERVSSSEKGTVIEWESTHFSVPHQLRGKEQECALLLNEALNARGWLYSRAKIYQVIVRIPGLLPNPAVEGTRGKHTNSD